MPRKKEVFDEMREITRRKIEEAALFLFARNGLSVTVGDIAKAAGISQGLMYSHYSSKNALIGELIRQATSASSQNVMDWIGTEESVCEKVKTISRLMCGMFTEVRMGIDYFMFMQQVSMSGFEIPAEANYTKDMPNPVEAFAYALAQGQAEGSVVDGDPLQLSTAYWALVQGMCCYAIMGIPTVLLPETLNRIVLKERFING